MVEQGFIFCESINQSEVEELWCASLYKQSKAGGMFSGVLHKNRKRRVIV